jgi:hypothetical protein
MTEHHDRDTVVVRDGGSSLGTILGALLIIALLIAVWYFTLGPGGGAGTDTDTDTNNNPVPTLEVPTQAPAGS